MPVASMRRISTLAVVASILTLQGCDTVSLPVSVDLDRETFVQTYVDLRLAALSSPRGELEPARRDSILQVHDVTSEQLLEFARVHGENPAYMTDVWDEITARMDGDLPDGDGAAADSTSG